MLGGLRNGSSSSTIDLPWFVLGALIFVAGGPVHLANADQGNGDFDNDCTVGLGDFASFGSCLGGPGGGLLDWQCWRGDFDEDGDVDLDDFGGFQSAFGADSGGDTGACCLPDDTCP